MKSLLTIIILFSSTAVFGQGTECFIKASADTARFGRFEFFGYAGIDVNKVRAELPIKDGEEFTSLETFVQLRTRTKDAVQKVLGKPATDVAFGCCDEGGNLFAYIGLPGASMKEFKYNPPPTGSAKLPEEGILLYKQSGDLLMKAVQSNSSEDDSNGYMLSSDPDLRKNNLAMREFALKNEPIINLVLRTSADKDQRTAAAELLGYAKQSKEQIENLVYAVRDSDSGVRNNATRALGVLASSDPKIAAQIPAFGFIDMLNSGKWTDRNKAGWVLLTLTKGRDPKLLGEIRAKALPALIEMARWRDPGHASEYRTILGRIGGIDEKKLDDMVEKNDQVESIISSVK